MELLRRSEAGERTSFDRRVREAVADVVQRQQEAGLDILNDGEQGKPGYATYIKDRVTGFGGQSRVTTVWAEGRDFPEYLARRTGNTRSNFERPCCIGPIEWRDFAAVDRGIDNLRAAVRCCSSMTISIK